MGVGLFIALLVLGGVALHAIEYEATDQGTAPRLNLAVLEKDRDAADGEAIRMAPEKKTSSMVADAYWYPPFPGRYRVTWRLKIDDNRGTDTVCVLNPYFAETPGPYPSLAVKPADFAAPGRYQEFVQEVTVPENRYGVYGVSFQAAPGRSVWWDWTRYTLLEAFDDARIAQLFYPKVPVADEIKRTPADEGLRVQVTAGTAFSSSGVGQALALLGLAPPVLQREFELPADMRFYRPPPPRVPGHWRETFVIDHGQVFDRLRGFPDSAAAFAGLDLIILANVPARSVDAPTRLRLQEWVRKAGGHLVLTGGMKAFGKGCVQGTVIEAMLPVRILRLNDTKAARDGAFRWRSRQIADSAGTARLETRFLHETQTLPEARVLIETADGDPLLVDWAYGAGRVTVWLGMPMGLAAGKDSEVWWKSAHWPAILAAGIK